MDETARPLWETIAEWVCFCSLACAATVVVGLVFPAVTPAAVVDFGSRFYFYWIAFVVIGWPVLKLLWLVVKGIGTFLWLAVQGTGLILGIGPGKRPEVD